MLLTKKKFVRYISHEIRTPLNVLSMGLEVLEGMPSSTTSLKDHPIDINISNNTKNNEVIQDLKEACDTAVGILNDLLLYDKIEDGSLVLEKKIVMARPLIIKCVRMFARPVSNLRRSNDYDIFYFKTFLYGVGARPWSSL